MPRSINTISPLSRTIILSGFKSMCTLPVEWNSLRHSTTLQKTSIKPFGFFYIYYYKLVGIYSCTKKLILFLSSKPWYTYWGNDLFFSKLCPKSFKNLASFRIAIFGSFYTNFMANYYLLLSLHFQTYPYPPLPRCSTHLYFPIIVSFFTVSRVGGC